MTTKHPDDPIYYAHRCLSKKGETYYAHMHTSRRFVELHYMLHPIVTVRLRERTEQDPPSSYWGWVKTEKPEEYIFVWPSEIQLETCFPGGCAGEETRGKGRKVNLIVEEVET